MNATLTLLIQLVMVGIVTFLIGYLVGRDWKKRPIDIKDIDGYIQEHFPTEWAAYHKGITEGYAQGVRDCGEDPK